ncbi:MAG TPA: hypothetical protein VF594_02435 [Rubricoccaceae bacterium]|jgi:hypothetical protein
MRFLPLGVLLAAFVLSAAPASAQNEYVQQVTRYLEAARSVLSEDGYTRTRAYTTASLAEGTERTFTFPLQRNTNYVVTGACDNDCSDIDFWLYDNNNNLIDSDTAADDRPVVNVTPARNGTFRLKVRMHGCSSSPCYYGFGIFRQ